MGPMNYPLRSVRFKPHSIGAGPRISYAHVDANIGLMVCTTTPQPVKLGTTEEQ